ncbi:lipase/ esterase [Rhizoctonia solani]|nr:lipase/ esterase [Rhizoctonia solani]
MATISPEQLAKLEPGYRAFVESSPPALPPLHGIPWSPAFRQPRPGGPPDLGTEPPIPVGSRCTIDLGNFSVQAMTPGGEQPFKGWPVVLYFHAGGWVFGDASIEDGLLSRLCMSASVVVISVDYRLAPEHPYPAAVDDSWDSFLWLRDNGAKELGIDPTRIALMGRSAGANLATVVAQRASLNSPRISVALQVLLNPMLDTTYTVEDRSRWTQSMIENENSFSFSTLDTLWLRDRYLPNLEDRKLLDASPNHQDNKLAFDGAPPTMVLLADLDPLRDDGQQYAQKLEQFGVPVTVKLLKG